MQDNIILNTLAKVALLFFLYVLVYYFFIGITARPHEGDSLAYHIPIAKSIANGTFIHPHYTFDHDYFPGSFESILAVFMLIHIPLNLYNVCAIIVLFFAMVYLATIFEIKRPYAILFAVAICTLNVVIRWISAQTVDIWLAGFYILTFALLLKPQNRWTYYLQLGFLTGMLLGTKYSGPLFVLCLYLLYGKPAIKYLSIRRFFVFLIPVLTFGVFWYIRNYVAIGNPFYPLDTPWFHGLKGNPIIEVQIWKTVLKYPKEMFDAFLGEYMIWAIFLLVLPLFAMYLRPVRKVLILGLLNFLIFLILPSGTSYQLHVSQYRFSYVVFIPLILSIFILAKTYKKEVALSFVCIANMFTLPSMSYHPKLLFLYIPLACILLFMPKRHENKFFPQEK